MDERDIRLLADGELSEEATDALLGRCDEKPELWRTLALALLEQRSLELAVADWGTSRSELESVARPPLCAAVESRPDHVRFDSFENADATLVSAAAKHDSRWSGSLQWLAGAACVAVICGALGYRIGQSLAGSMSNLAMTEQVAQQPARGSQVGELNSERVEANQPRDSVLEPERSDSMSPSSLAETRRDIPEYYISAPINSGVVTPEKQREWLRRGLWVEEVPTVEEYELDGRRFVVPRSRYDVKYVGGLAYQ